jgi:hypothetical protein
MSVDVHETYAELERVRREIATLNHNMTDAYPDWQEAATARLRKFEEQERDLLQQLAELERLEGGLPGVQKSSDHPGSDWRKIFLRKESGGEN